MSCTNQEEIGWEDYLWNDP